VYFSPLTIFKGKELLNLIWRKSSENGNFLQSFQKNTFPTIWTAARIVFIEGSFTHSFGATQLVASEG